MIIKGLKRRSGEFEGNKYDNMNVHCLGDDDGTMAAGVPVEIVKVPYPIFMSCYSGDPADLIGAEVRFSYNKYGKVDGMSLI